MKRIRLKNGGKTRHKAFLGADGAVMAAATLSAAGINAAATTSSAKTQAKAAVENAKTQAQSIKEQTANNTALQKESINFTRQQNQENRQQQQDIQTTLQMMAGQENMNDRMEASKMVVKYGGKTKRSSIKSSPFYGGAGMPFNVTDGGAVLPLQIDNNGFGLYEIIGDTHEQSHKTPNGKRKTGVGIKFNNGDVIEGEGNGNTNQGELMYVTPKDAFFLSKHNIDGYNPTQAVLNGTHPIEAYNVQEILKDINGLNDDGSKIKNRKSIKKLYGGYNILQNNSNITNLPSNGTKNIAGGVIYKTNTNSTPVDRNVARNGKRVSLRRCGGSRKKAEWGDYAGATYSSIGNVLGAGVNVLGNMYASGILGDAYSEAGNILADAYGSLQTIDESFISRDNYAAPHTLAVVRRADTNVNPQVERIRRNADAEKREINRGTMSSAARQQRLAATNDRMTQRIGEQYAWKHNQDETIKQANAERITQTAQDNANRDVQANKDYTQARLSLKQYNNNIVNQRILGAANAKATALTQSTNAEATALQASGAAIGSAVGAAGNAFASAVNAKLERQHQTDAILAGLDTKSAADRINSLSQTEIDSYYNRYSKSSDPNLRAIAASLNHSKKQNSQSNKNNSVYEIDTDGIV